MHRMKPSWKLQHEQRRAHQHATLSKWQQTKKRKHGGKRAQARRLQSLGQLLFAYVLALRPAKADAAGHSGQPLWGNTPSASSRGQPTLRRSITEAGPRTHMAPGASGLEELILKGSLSGAVLVAIRTGGQPSSVQWDKNQHSRFIP